MAGAMAVPVCVCLPYLKKDDLYICEKPYTADFPVDHIPGATQTNHRFDYQDLLFEDAQNTRVNFNLEQHGFCFIKGKTSVTSSTADDDEYIRKVYFPEVEKILHKALPGYERIDYLDHLVSLLSGYAVLQLTVDCAGPHTRRIIPRETRRGHSSCSAGRFTTLRLQ